MRPQGKEGQRGFSKQKQLTKLCCQADATDTSMELVRQQYLKVHLQGTWKLNLKSALWEIPGVVLDDSSIIC